MQDSERRDALAERLIAGAAAMMELAGVYIGDRLGFYRTLAEAGPLTAGELSERSGAAERYAREWLEHQAVAGCVAAEDENAPSGARRYFLPPGHREVLADPDSLSFLAPLAQTTIGGMRAIDKVIEAYRGGHGVPYEDYGKDVREGVARLNRAPFLQQLGQQWIPMVDGIHGRLAGTPPARVADFGCGCGWSSIGLAQAYPNVRVDGFDLDAASIEEAHRNAEAHGLGDRVRFWVRDAGDPELAGQYDLVMALECVHDMSNPVAALDTMRRLVNGNGAVLVMDERAEETFRSGAGLIERLLYGFSILHCLPVGMAEQPSAGTGTVMRTGALWRYALDAGFCEVEVLPIDHPMWRFYRLVP